MAKRSVLAKKEISSLLPRRSPIIDTLSLPTEKSEASHNIEDYLYLIHGLKKIGKTTFSIQGGNVLLLTFDPVEPAYEIFQRHCPNWETFEGYITLLEQAAANGSYPYSRVVFDRTDIAYRECQKYICKKAKVRHPTEANDFGMTWDELYKTYEGAVKRLMALPGGCWFLCHSENQETENRKGEKHQLLAPMMKDKASEAITGRVQAWFAYTYDGSDRVLVTLGDERTNAGHKIKGHFLTQDGRRVREIYMGENEEQSWDNFVNAFNNNQTYATIAELRAAKVAEKRLKGGGLKIKRAV